MVAKGGDGNSRLKREGDKAGEKSRTDRQGEEKSQTPN